ncbi:MAG: hypothetical protein J5895_03990 [Alphaproteobacteria bacterium]|nr:hypothetical protein [Alphaproteobacteria bacterium]
MNENLINTYVANKVAKWNCDFALLKQQEAKEDFVRDVLSAPLTVIPTKLKRDIEQKISERFGLKPHRSIFFKTRTIEQWLHDVTGCYTVSDFLTAFEQNTGLGRFYFEKSDIDHFDRVLLISLVEKFEEATGKVLIENDNLSDSLTFREIAVFFSA